MEHRRSGILLHVTSLPSNYGIGDMGFYAYEFIDFLKKAGQNYWQILPLGPIGFGNSPYQSFSSYGGNHLLIDLDDLVNKDFVDREFLNAFNFSDDKRKVNYSHVIENKTLILREAFKNFKENNFNDYERFIDINSNWIKDYSFYMALRDYYKFLPWQKWDRDLILRKDEVLKKYEKLLDEGIRFWKFVQYIFYGQWTKLKKYANENGIYIIGDIPIYVASDSADTWSNKEIFKFDDNMVSKTMSGCPPDAFAITGQLWGNPIYDWEALKKQNYKWWIERIKNSMELYDVIRIDHFRGIESYWEIPMGHTTAEHGKWVKGPGLDFINAVKNSLPNVNIIAEDLGYITEEVKKLRMESGFPGMKVLEFAFDSREESDYLPHNYEKNCVVYTGTHDNDTVGGWLKNANKDDINYAINYLKLTEEEGYNWGFIRGAWSSVGNLAVAQMQDFLNLDSYHRMNTPSTVSNNWTWRVLKEEINEKLAYKIYDMTKTYGRII